MLQYLIKRLLVFIPSLGVMSLVVFYFSQYAQQDVILQKQELLTAKQEAETFSLNDNYQIFNKLEFHKPLYYWSVFRKSSCDTLNRIQDNDVRNKLEEIAYSIGNWERTNEFYSDLKELGADYTFDEKQNLRDALLNSEVNENQTWFLNNKKINQLYIQLISERSCINNYLVTIQWNGTNNQYHEWLSNLFSGNFGISTQDNSSINEKVNNAIFWTLVISFISIFISCSIGISLAFYTTFNPHKFLAQMADKVVLLFYAIPNFWVATLLILFFASGDFLAWFPTYGLGNTRGMDSDFNLFLLRAKHLILPVIALSYGPIAIIYKQLKNAIETELSKEYIKTAKAKGLKSNSIKWNQLFKNACFPLITLVGKIIPALLSGSFIIEYIFSIPGMGKVSMEALLSRDFPTLYILLLISTFMAMLGVLVADLLYFSADPRVQFTSNNSIRKI